MCPVLNTIYSFSNKHYLQYTHHLPHCPGVSWSKHPSWWHSHFHVVHILFDDCIHLEIIMIQYEMSFGFFIDIIAKFRLSILIFLFFFIQGQSLYSTFFDLITQGMMQIFKFDAAWASSCIWLLLYHTSAHINSV